jgi:hypothetical protein
MALPAKSGVDDAEDRDAIPGELAVCCDEIGGNEKIVLVDLLAMRIPRSREVADLRLFIFD